MNSEKIFLIRYFDTSCVLLLASIEYSLSLSFFAGFQIKFIFITSFQFLNKFAFSFLFDGLFFGLKECFWCFSQLMYFCEIDQLICYTQYHMQVPQNTGYLVIFNSITMREHCLFENLVVRVNMVGDMKKNAVIFLHCTIFTNIRQSFWLVIKVALGASILEHIFECFLISCIF